MYTQVVDPADSCCTLLRYSPLPGLRYFLRVEGSDITSEIAWFETPEELDAPMIEPKSNLTHPVVFRDFSVTGALRSARLYVTGLGLYWVQINEKRVGQEYLTPNCNDYDDHVQYQSYDVLEHLQSGNRIEIHLGDGWYKGRFGLQHLENIYGSTYLACAKLVLNYEDGHRETVRTDEHWRCRQSAVASSNIYDGEIVDATRDCTATYPVTLVNPGLNLVPRTSLPILVQHQIRPILITSPSGEQILDFGQNFAGFVSFRCKLNQGQTLRLQAGEVLQNGCFYRENLRTAKAEYVYTSDGTQKAVAPQFTFYGFRYMLVEGMDSVNPDDFVGCVLYSDLEQTVSIKTDNGKINRLLQNCLWGQRSNFVDVPTDCPQRDERLGWTGDAEVFSKTACYQMNCQAFYAKYLQDISIDQKQMGGIVPMFSPTMKQGQNGCAVWTDAATIIPWNLYQFYGDTELLRSHFPMMEAHVQTIIREDQAHGAKRLHNFGFHLGDWLSQDGMTANSLKGATDEFFIASAYYYQSVKLTALAADALQETEKASYYCGIAEEIKSAILREYFTPNGRLSIDTQTAYTICIMFGLWVDKARLIEGFASRLKRDCYTIRGGFVGAPQLIQSLISCGLENEAFRILFSEAYPGWLHCVNLGATTIWERWNALNPDGSISSTGMNSLNHYSFGAVAEAFYGYIAGLQPAAPGFKKVSIAPKFNYRLRNLEFSYLSVSGMFQVNYCISPDNQIHLEVIIPYGAEATLYLPDREPQILSGGKYQFTVTTDIDYRHPFSVDSAIADLVANPQPSELLKKAAPVLYYFLSTNDMGLNGMSLRELTRLDSFKVPEDRIIALDQALRAITVG